MNLLQKIRAKYVLLHFLFWVAVWFFFIYFFSYNSENTEYVVWFASFLLPVTMLITYFTVYYLIPRYLLTKKYKLFALYSVYTLVFSSYLIVLTIFGSFLFLSNFKITNMPLMSRNFVFILILVFLVVAIISFISLLNYNFKTASNIKELQNKILEAQLALKKQELKYLRKQIHPHFLFNTLNTIYALALKQSDRTAEVILKLSNLLDYLLYQLEKPYVRLVDEVLHIKEYIELEEIRFQDNLKIYFNFDKQLPEISIAPMLFIPLVENAFKHRSFIDGFLTIDIRITMLDEYLTFSIKNSALKSENKEDLDNGIGLENIQKRLELLYPGNYNLAIEHQDNCFKVELSIKTNCLKND